MEGWGLNLLGRCELRTPAGVPVAPKTRKALALLVYLACQPGRRASRERLAALLWPDADPQQSRLSLRKALSALRQLGEPPLIETEGDLVLVPPGAVLTDLERLDQDADPDLYAAEFLQDFSVRDAPEFDDWTAIERQRLRETAVRRLADDLDLLLADRQAPEAATHLAMRLLALDPLNERAHRALMTLHARQGRPAAALKQYRTLVEALDRELGVQPEPATQTLYREISAERRAAPPEPAAAPSAATPDGDRPAETVLSPRRRLRPWLVAAGLGALAILGAGAWALRPAPAPPQIGALRLAATARGEFFRPDLSPDGTRVAYASRYLSAGNADLYLRALDGSPPQRLTSDPDIDDNAAWSPDGASIAFTRTRQGGREPCRVMVMGVPGGQERMIGTCQGVSTTRLSWSGDSRSLYMTGKPAPGGATALYRVEIASGAVSQVTDAPDDMLGDDEPMVSPDGRRLAFLRHKTWTAADVIILDLASGKSRALTTDGSRIWGAAWDGDGRGVLFSSNRGGDIGLWWVPLRGGEPRRISSGLLEFRAMSHARQRDRLAFEALRDRSDLVEGPERTPLAGLPPPGDRQSDWFPAAAGDGALAFVSQRSGDEQLWTLTPAGLRRITSLPPSTVGEPRWSPDGSRLAFVATRGGRSDILIVGRDGGAVLQLTNDDADDASPVWSADGGHVYFTSRRSGAWRIWRAEAGAASADKPAPATAIGQEGPRAVRLGPDPALGPAGALYAVMDGKPGIWKASASGGWSRVVSDSHPGDWMNWDVVGGGLFYIRRGSDGASGTVLRRDLVTGAERELSPARGLLQLASFSVRPSGELILVRRETDMQLMVADLTR